MGVQAGSWKSHGFFHSNLPGDFKVFKLIFNTWRLWKTARLIFPRCHKINTKKKNLRVTLFLFVILNHRLNLLPHPHPPHTHPLKNQFLSFICVQSVVATPDFNSARNFININWNFNKVTHWNVRASDYGGCRNPFITIPNWLQHISNKYVCQNLSTHK